ncbi:hypothetical protein U9M48_038780 [Paspalum notatum var. saurae]|uniref:Uncharacterized protein n=1 Tax=Paspalum notatum var. saurae TaxID=547442 RepID=A0AAQ3XAP4_PASNO
MLPGDPLRSYLLFITVILATSSRGACLCRQEQSDALLRLKGSFRFDDSFSRTFPSWIFHNKSLISLDASSNDNLCGELLEFTMASTLQILILSGTRFGGKMPESIGNNLTGSLPSEGYFALHNLTTVTLSNNSVLDVGNNLIMDTFPEWLGVLPLLKVLVLHSNRFHGSIGPIDDSYGMKKLQVLDLSSNSFNGSIPERFLTQFQAMMVVSSGSVSTYVDIIAPASASSPS